MIRFSERRDTTRSLFISRVTQDEKGLEFAVRCESPKASSAAVSCWIIGRGERIRTTDLTVPNRWSGKNVSLCLFKSCSHRRFSRVLHLSHPLRPVTRRVLGILSTNWPHGTGPKQVFLSMLSSIHKQGVYLATPINH